MMSEKRTDVITALQADILRLQGFKAVNNAATDVGLGPIRYAFPNGTFPLGCIHEFISAHAEGAAATGGFLAGLLATLMRGHGAVIWISTSRTLFPPALKTFGIEPDRFIFVDLRQEKDVLWVMDEALKCSAVTAVVGEMRDISFTASRRLQLAVEQSQVTGFILRHTRRPTTTACISRWKITPLPSETIDDLPGIGFPRWNAELLRIRNGKPGSWNIQWINGRFVVNTETLADHDYDYFTLSASAGKGR
jgi:protein ImuA